MLKGIGDIGRLIQMARDQAEHVQENMEQKKRELAQRRLQGASGGGIVTVGINGNREILEIKIDHEAIGGDTELLEGLLVAAVNDAIHRVDRLQREELSGVIGDVTSQFGGLQNLMRLFGSSSTPNTPNPPENE